MLHLDVRSNGRLEEHFIAMRTLELSVLRREMDIVLLLRGETVHTSWILTPKRQNDVHDLYVTRQGAEGREFKRTSIASEMVSQSSNEIVRRNATSSTLRLTLYFAASLDHLCAVALASSAVHC